LVDQINDLVFESWQKHDNNSSPKRPDLNRPNLFNMYHG